MRTFSRTVTCSCASGFQACRPGRTFVVRNIARGKTRQILARLVRRTVIVIRARKSAAAGTSPDRRGRGAVVRSYDADPGALQISSAVPIILAELAELSSTPAQQRAQGEGGDQFAEKRCHSPLSSSARARASASQRGSSISPCHAQYALASFLGACAIGHIAAL